MSKSEEKPGCPETSGRSSCCRGIRAKEQCPWLRFCGQSEAADKSADKSSKHDHENGTCPFLAKVRSCGYTEKNETVPEECATWMCWFYYMLGRQGSNPWAHGRGGGPFMPPFSSDTDSSESEEEAASEGMDTEAVGAGTATETEVPNGGENESGESGPIPIEFVQHACWAYYMIGANEGSAPPMGPWGSGFGGGYGPRGPPPFVDGDSGFGPFGFGQYHGDPPAFGPFGQHHGGPPAFGPFGNGPHHGGPPSFGPFGHHHGGPPPFGPFGRPGKCHRHHKRHGPSSMFPGMFGGMFGGPHHRHLRRCHRRGGPHCGRGGVKGFGPHCPKVWLSKVEKDATKKTE